MSFDALREDLAASLARAARVYLQTGLDLFYGSKKADDGALQASIGNLSVGVELTLKAVLVQADPALAFKDLPVEARAMFAAGPRAKGFNGRPYELDLRDFSFEPVSFEDAVRAFYVFVPEHKQFLRPYFKQMEELKRFSLQACLAQPKAQEAARAAYLALQVCALAGRCLEVRKPSETDRAFVKRYEQERAKSVAERLAAAREKARTLKVDITFNEPPPPDGWEAFDARCPVCKNWAFVSGTTDIRCEKKAGKETEALDFFADSFDCDACGLRLDDIEELRLADIPLQIDRSEDLPKWRDDKHD